MARKSAKFTVRVDGVAELIRDLHGFHRDLNFVCAATSQQSMAPALNVAKNTTIFNDAGQAHGRWKHPPGNLRKKIAIFSPPRTRRNMNASWTSIGVPRGSGAAYYIPLNQGHKVKNARNPITGETYLYSRRKNAKTFVAPRPFLQEAFRRGRRGAPNHYRANITKLVQAYNSRIGGTP
jgi:hypothetical protein